jgi:hypothetical protein
MASFTFDAGQAGIANRSIDFIGDVIKVMLLGTATPYTPNKAEANMTTPAASELSVTGYVGGFAGAGRQTLASKTITNDTTNHRTVFDAADPAAQTLATGGTVAAAIVYKHLTSDALSTPIFYLDPADTPTNGSTFQLIFDVLGIGYIQN